MTRDQAAAECARLIALHGITAAELEQPAVKFTRCPSTPYDPRYQFAPGAVTFGAGFAAVGIGRDVDTGREWR